MVKKYQFTLLIVLFLCGFINSLKTQTNTLNDDWRWIHFTTETGLPSNRVFDIIETTTGIVWARTQSGLAWFNGYYWDTVGLAAGLHTNKIDIFLPGMKDNILILSNGKLYYGDQHGFKSIPFILNSVEKKVNGIASLHKNEFICLCDSVPYLIKEGEFSPISFSMQLGKIRVLSLWSTNGAPWINTTNGLYRFENNEWILKLKSKRKPISLKILVENEKGNGLTFLFSPREYYGLWEWNEGGVPVFNSKESIEQVLAIDIGFNRHAFMIKESNICMSYDGRRWSTLFPTLRQFQNVIFIKYRPDGDLWVATEEGLFLHREFYKKWTDIRFQQPDTRNNVNEIVKRKDGSIWMGTGQGLLVYEPDGSVKTIDKIQGKKLGLITGIAEDNDGNLWISSGSSFEGAYRWAGSQLKYFGVKDGLDAGYIHKIKKDKHGNIWFLGLSRSDYESRKIEEEPGAYIYSNGKFKQWETNQGLINGRVYDMEESAGGALWFGTNGGLCRWLPDSSSGSKGKWSYWTIKEGLLMNRVFTIAIDSQNTVWFGDQNNGLGFIDNDTPKYLTTQNGLISDAVWRVVVDTSGKLWIGTRGGVSIYDRGIWSSIDNSEGLEFTNIWPMLAADGKIFIGSFGGGVCILNLDAIYRKYPEVVLGQPIIHRGVLFMSCNAFSYFGIQRSENIEIRYRIDDSTWTAWTRQREIVIGGLSSGDHVLQIQAKNLIGEYNSQGKTISFYVDPPYYLMPVFYLSIGVLSFGLIILGSKYLLRKKRQDVELRKSEIRYRNLFDMANDAIIIFEPVNEKILEVNNKAMEIYGFTKDELIGMSFKSISKNVEFCQGMIQQILQDRRSKTFDTVHINKSGNEIYMHINASVINYDGSEAILSLNRDVTEQKLAEAQIRLLAQTVASAQDYVSITDLDNNILFVNNAFCKAYGYTPEEITGENISIIRSTTITDEKTNQMLKSTLNDGWNGEILNKKKDGTDFLVELWTSVVKNERGDPVGVVGVARDISERKQHEIEREKLIAELKEALADIKMLSGLLPICSSCKKIRDDGGYWTQVETYVEKHSEATFTHGLCPECAKKYFPEIYEKIKDKNF